MSRRPTERELCALPTVAVDVLASLHQHRLLTARQIHTLHTPTASLRWTQAVLAELRARRLVERAIGAHGQGLWFVTDHGADTVHTTGDLVEPRRRVTTPAQAAGPLRRHTLAVNDAGIAFVTAARERAGDDCGPLSWRHEIAHPFTAGRGRHGTHLLVADALLSYMHCRADESVALLQCFIELDRGTIPVEQLAVKLGRYAQLRRHETNSTSSDASRRPLWRSYYRAFPKVLIVLADQTPGAARKRIRRVITMHLADPDRERYGITTASFVTLADLIARGPFAPIFVSVEQPDSVHDWLGNTPTHQTKGGQDVHA